MRSDARDADFAALTIQVPDTVEPRSDAAAAPTTDGGVAAARRLQSHGGNPTDSGEAAGRGLPQEDSGSAPGRGLSQEGGGGAAAAGRRLSQGGMVGGMVVPAPSDAFHAWDDDVSALPRAVEEESLLEHVERMQQPCAACTPARPPPPRHCHYRHHRAQQSRTPAASSPLPPPSSIPALADQHTHCYCCPASPHSRRPPPRHRHHHHHHRAQQTGAAPPRARLSCRHPPPLLWSSIRGLVDQRTATAAAAAAAAAAALPQIAQLRCWHVSRPTTPLLAAGAGTLRSSRLPPRASFLSSRRRTSSRSSCTRGEAATPPWSPDPSLSPIPHLARDQNWPCRYRSPICKHSRSVCAPSPRNDREFTGPTSSRCVQFSRCCRRAL